MKTIGNFVFPETAAEAKTWLRHISWRAFDPRVLAVATTRQEGAWAAYIGSVPGAKHEREYGSVLANGTKLPEDIACTMFPGFANIPYAP